MGGLLGLLAVFLQAVNLPFQVAAALLLVAWVATTGALHLDGLADTADGWLGGHGERDRILEIMRDPAVGAGGVVAVAVLLLLKWAALWSLMSEGIGIVWLMLAPAVARGAALGIMLTAPYARSQGLAAAAAAHLQRRTAWSMLVAMVAVVVGVVGQGALWALGGLLGGLWWWRRWMTRKLGGYTGDTLGAVIEGTEAIWLVAGVLACG